MKERLLISSYTAEQTGPTLSLVLLVSYLVERFDVEVLTPRGGWLTAELDRMGVPHRSLGMLTKWSIPVLAWMVRRGGFDLVYANTTHSTDRIAWVGARLAGAAFVNHVRAMGWDRGRLRLGYLGHADAVIAVSGACADSVRRFVPADRLHVVHNGVPMPAPSNSPRPAARQRLGLADSDVAVVSLAHICERKGQTFAVRAMKDLPKRTGVKLFLVGSVEREPEYTTCIESQIREYGLEERVSLLGFRSDVSDLLRAADIMVHTALADPHPRAVVEAMSYGLPVVAFATDGVVETVSDGETGILVRPEDSRSLADAMADLANSPDRRARLGGAGRVRASSMFSAESTARGVEGILDAVLQSRRSTYQRKTP